MKVPLSWIKDFVEISLPVEELAHRLTMAGLEVEEVRYVGFPLPEDGTPGAPARTCDPRPRPPDWPGMPIRSWSQRCAK